MGSKVYAIKEGFDKQNNIKIQDKIVYSWDECLKYVGKVKGAKYKSFKTEEEAKAFLKDHQKLLKKGVDEYPKDIIHAYVDGSFNQATDKYSYGLVVVKNDVIIYLENGVAKDTSEKNIRQIAGELKASVRALEYIKSIKENKLVLFHDYEGICHHATGFWQRKDISSKIYYEKMNDLIKNDNIDIVFVKVDSHTGDLYNEIADEQAKIAAGLEVSVVNKYLANHKINVADDKIKQDLIKLTLNYSDNILIV